MPKARPRTQKQSSKPFKPSGPTARKPRRARPSPTPSLSPPPDLTPFPFLAMPEIITNIFSHNFTRAELALYSTIASPFPEALAPLFWKHVEIGDHEGSMLFLRLLGEVVQARVKSKGSDMHQGRAAHVQSISLRMEKVDIEQHWLLHGWAATARSFAAAPSRRTSSDASDKDTCSHLRAIEIRYVMDPEPAAPPTIQLYHPHLAFILEIIAPRGGPRIFRFHTKEDVRWFPESLSECISSKWYNTQRYDLFGSTQLSTCTESKYPFRPDLLERVFARYDRVPLVRTFGTDWPYGKSHPSALLGDLHKATSDSPRLKGRFQLIGPDHYRRRLRDMHRRTPFKCKPVFRTPEQADPAGKPWWTDREGQGPDEEGEEEEIDYGWRSDDDDDDDDDEGEAGGA